MMTWQDVFLVFAAAILSTLALLPLIQTGSTATRAELEESLGQILRKAFRDPSYTLIFLGFFSCGYQLAFITAHFPAFVTEMCGAIDPSGTLASIGVSTTSALGAISISLVGLANIAGTLLAGYLGKSLPKKYLLAAIYVGRTIVAALFIMMPITPTSVIVFFHCHGVPVVGGRSAHIRAGRPYLWATLHGDTLRDHLCLTPVGQLSWGVARGADV
ncbi:hypothetical protein SAMN04488527_10836 [Aliiroseovarius crassostreae]|nr:hypothetical protein SAMN04488527_10836 [Aliiroseovarius crassostreae]